MLLPVVQDVAALAKRLEVRGRVVARVVIQVGTGQIHPGGIARRVGWDCLGRCQLQLAALAAAPGLRHLIPPAPVPQVADQLAVGAATAFAAAFGPPEADHLGELHPVDWVEEAVFRADRHDA